MHEDFSRGREIKGSSDRSFGIVMTAFFVLVALLPMIRAHQPVRWWALIVAAVALFLAYFWTAPLKPLNRVWTLLAVVLNRIVSPIALGILFFAGVTLVGVLMRAFGQDPLRLRMDPNASSYWIPRMPPGPAPDSMKRLF